MPRVDDNADVYAAKRLNIFFPGVVPSLDGQCVSLVKWFMAEMSEVPNPQAARGDARYVGKTLVAQGHAVEVPYSDRKRGDIICYEYGQYGHVGVVLSGDRTFEENVGWPGVSAKIVDGEKVWASRIGNLYEAWRHDQHIYRLKSYKEGEDIMPDLVNDRGDAINFLRNDRGDSSYQPTEAEIDNVMKTTTYKDWAYRLGSLDEGDAVNMLNQQKLPVTDANKSMMLGEGYKYWMYNFSGKLNGEYEEISVPVFRKK